MKTPKYPNKPYPPYKPVPPPEKVDENTNIGSFKVDKYDLYTLESFAALVKKNAPGDIDPKDIKFEFEDEQEWMYDDCTVTIVANLITQRQIDNPRLKILTKVYEDALKKYEKDYEKYKEDIKKYHADMKVYEVEHDKWQLEQSKAQVKKLEKKLKVKK